MLKQSRCGTENKIGGTFNVAINKQLVRRFAAGKNGVLVANEAAVFKDGFIGIYVQRQCLADGSGTEDGITVSLGIGIVGVVFRALTSRSGVEENRLRSAFHGVEIMEWRAADRGRVKKVPIGVDPHSWNGPQEV